MKILKSLEEIESVPRGARRGAWCAGKSDRSLARPDLLPEDDCCVIVVEGGEPGADFAPEVV